MREGYYFGAGPAPLATKAVTAAAEQFVEYEGLGVGLGEISHRSKQATQIINDAKSKIGELLSVPDTHEVLFVQGGGTGGFSAVIYSMLAAFAKKTGKKGKADYLVTGSWSAKAAQEAKRLGVDVNIVCDGKKSGKYTQIPSESEWKLSDPAETAFVYYCDNETVDGIEFPVPPRLTSDNVVMDISSNMLSRPIDVSKYAIVFGGAQKNVGIAGVSIYIVRRDILDQAPADELLKLGVPVAPSLLDLTLVAKNNSAYNTISIFAVQVVNLVVSDLLSKTLKGQQDESGLKAKLIYEVIDSKPDVYITSVAKSSRSRMNIVFNLASEEAESKFINGAAERKLTGLKGHRSVGGIRISNYNAISMEAVEQLLAFMKDFH